MASVIENSKIRINQFIIDSHKIPKEFEGYKIVFLTDLHSVTFGKNNCTLISRIDEINPDVILIGGDMIVGKPNYPVDIPIRLINILAEKKWLNLKDENLFKRKEKVAKYLLSKGYESNIVFELVKNLKLN